MGFRNMQEKLENDSSLNQSQSKLTTKLADTFQSKIDLVPALESDGQPRLRWTLVGVNLTIVYSNFTKFEVLEMCKEGPYYLLLPICT